MAAATKVAQNPQLVARLQSEASRNPRLYRLRLALIAIAGDFALLATQVGPWAAPIVIGVLWVNAPVFYWLGGAAILLFAWMLRPTFRFTGRELKPGEAPQLHAELARLKEKLRVPGRMRVYLDGSFNASAAETRGLFGLFGTQSALTLGVPLLAALDREKVLAVIAHEFGHFSRRHGRLGNWLYRARVGWLAYAEQVTESDSAFDRAAAWYARHFVPFFSARSFVHSRQCEYEADADAAHAAGSKSVAQALTRIAVLGRLWEQRLPRQIAAWQAQMPQPPADFHERFVRLCQECSVADLQTWLDEELRAPSGWLDTHPSLSERLASLQEAPVLAPVPDCAGERLLEGSWPAMLAEFNTKWAREIETDWLVEHLRLKHIAGPLLAADAATVAGFSDEGKLARAKALRVVDPAAGLAALRELHQRNPAHAQVTFAYAAALLSEDDEEGQGLLEVLAREHPAFRVKAFQRVLAYFERRGNTWQVERWSGWLTAVAENLDKAISVFMQGVESGKAQPSALPHAEQSLIAEAIGREPCIRNHWLHQGTASLKYAQDRPAIPIVVHVLALAVDPEEMRRREQDEEAISKRYQDLLRTLIPPDQFRVVPTYFITENLPPIYR